MRRADAMKRGGMSCDMARSAWHDRCDGALPAPLVAELATHLERCVACGAYAAQMAAICGGLAELGAASATAFGKGAAMRSDAGRTRRLRYLGFAMVGAAAALFATLWYGHGFDDLTGAVRHVADGSNPRSGIAAETADESVHVQANRPTDCRGTAAPLAGPREVAMVEMVGDSEKRFVPIEQETSVPNVHLFRVLPAIEAAAAAAESQPTAS